MSEKKISVLIIYTGGTIGMIQDPETGALMPFNFDHLLDNVPELKRLGFLISSIQFRFFGNRSCILDSFGKNHSGQL